MAIRSAKLFTLTIRQPGCEEQVVRIERFPFLVGRSPDASLRLEAPGVWDRHLAFEIDRDEGVVARAGDSALVTIDGRRLEKQKVRNGDLMTLGAVTLQVVLTPLTRRHLGLWEFTIWTVFVAVAAAQVYLIWFLLP